MRPSPALALAVLLGYCCVRATQYATHQGESLGTSSPGLEVPYFYAIASMAVGYYFITLHYLAGVARGATGLAARGRDGAREAVAGAGRRAGHRRGCCGPPATACWPWARRSSWCSG